MNRHSIPGVGLASILGLGTFGTPCPAQSSIPQRVLPAPESSELPLVFSEPLLALGDPKGAQASDDLKGLRQALAEMQKGQTSPEVSPLLRFLEAHPASPWRASVLANLADVYRRQGLFGKAMEAATLAWEWSRTNPHPNAVPVGDQAAGALLDLFTRVGNRDRLKGLFTQLQVRPLRGSAAQKAISAKRMYWKMVNQPETSFQCGPMALASIAPYRGHEPLEPRRPQEARSIDKGTSLAQNLEWGTHWQLGLQAAKRDPGAEVLLPAVVHWKTGHYSALVEARNGFYRMLDPTYGEDLWISAQTLDEEATGFALVSWGTLPKGWRAVEKAEAETVWGKGDVGLGPNDGPFPGDDLRPLYVSSGRAEYGIYPGYSSLTVKDRALGYQPPRGFPVRFELRYHQRFAHQPQSFRQAHVGPNWSFNWSSYLEDEPNQPLGAVRVITAEGGQHTFTGFDPRTGGFTPQLRTREHLARTGPAAYERRFADGSREVFGYSNGASFPRRVFLTQRIDAAGNALTFTYDAQGRLATLADPLGQVSRLAYGDKADAFRVTQVTDPFGRSATLEYTPDGQLAKVTDAAGLSYAYTYGPDAASPEAPTDFLRAMKTPYGTYAFSTKEEGMVRWLEVLDPMGGKERVEFHNDVKEVKSWDDVLPPPGSNNQYLDLRNSYVWDRKAMALHPGDFNKAEILHYIHGATMSVLSSLLECEKKPLENRVWYRYPGMLNNVSQGIGSQPSQVGRTLAKGVFEIRTATFNEWGNPLQTTDSTGRIRRFRYSPDGLDLLEIREGEGPAAKVLRTTTYNTQHQPLSVTETDGTTRHFTYNAFGQLTGIQGPKGKGVTFRYDPQGTLRDIAEGGSRLEFTYDATGRIRTLAKDGKKPTTLAYDALDRLLKATYPDGTKEAWTYDHYDVTSIRDRQGRASRLRYDALRRLVRLEGPQTWTLGWSPVGGLLSLQEGGKPATTWERDLQDRLTTKTQPDGARREVTYDPAGRATWREAGRPKSSKGKRPPLEETQAPASWQAQDIIRFFQAGADRLATGDLLSEGEKSLPPLVPPTTDQVQTYLRAKATGRDPLGTWLWLHPLVAPLQALKP